MIFLNYYFLEMVNIVLYFFLVVLCVSDYIDSDIDDFRLLHLPLSVENHKSATQSPTTKCKSVQ